MDSVPCMTLPDPNRDERPRLLILGGTAEARALAAALAARGDYEVSLSLAGRTRNPLDQPAPVRSGGFGGAQGLAAHLRAERIDALIDATHPFAANISRNAAEAARLAGVPLLALQRPEWTRRARRPLDRGRRHSRRGGQARHRAAPRARRPRPQRGACPGSRAAAPLAGSQHRSGRAAARPALRRHHRGARPLPEADERALLTANRIDAVLSKNSGGAATYGKIAAARALGIEVIMVARPARPKVETVESVEAALAWLERHLSPARRGV